jgi:predicted phosphohydrolase
MRFVAISDTHCRHHHLQLPKGDVMLHAGDVTMRGLRSELLDFLLWFGHQPFRYKIFIAGNHDFCLEKLKPDALQSLLPPGVIYLNDSGTTVEGIHIWGSPVTPFHHNWAFNRHRGAHIRRHWQRIPSGTDILLTHTPPFGVLDELLSEKNNGDKDLLETVNALQPTIHVFGHIHEAYGKKVKSPTQFYNCSLMNEQYEVRNKPFTFDLTVPVTVSSQTV